MNLRKKSQDHLSRKLFDKKIYQAFRIKVLEREL